MEFDETFLHDLEVYRQSAFARAKRQRYLTLLNPQPGEQILDLGCGSGEFCRALLPYVAPTGQITGLDNSPGAIQLAIKLAGEEGRQNLTFEHGDGHDLTYEPERFDAAVCISVLPFCTDPIRVLRELLRVLVKGGRLLAVNGDEDTRIYNCHDRQLGRRILRAMADRACDPWVGRRLCYLVRQAGFTIVEKQVLADVEEEFKPGNAGYTLAHSMKKQLLSTGISAHEYHAWLADLHSCAQDGSYSYSVTTFVCLAEA